jgi:hypothetical protein
MSRWQSSPGDDAGQQHGQGKGLSVGVGSPTGAGSGPVTRHTCNDGRGPAWGRKTPGCPRCDELAAGAEPVTWNTQAERDRAWRAARQAATKAAIDRAYAAVRAQLDTCCQLRVAAYISSDGAVRQVCVAGCPRHGTGYVAVRPVPLQLGYGHGGAR